MHTIIIHQHDPTIHYAGGIGTFINAFVKYAPSDLDVSLVGVVTDPARYRIGRWHQVRVGERACRFLPIVAGHPVRRDPVPLTLRFTWALRRYRAHLGAEDAILTFHRIEPTLAVRRLPNPKVLFLHGHIQDLRNPKTEMTWGKFPWLYFWLEGQLIQTLSRVYICRKDALAFYQARYPALTGRLALFPTLVDGEIFRPLAEAERVQIRRQLAQTHHFSPESRIVVFVGRFEGSKDPLLLLEAFRRLNGKAGQALLVLIGAGTLAGAMQAFIQNHGLSKTVRILEPKVPREIARWMNIADCFVLSSAYEGMPIAVLEALRCGVPVVSTAVGEIPRLVPNDRVGRLVRTRDPEAFAEAIVATLRQPPDRDACQRQVAPYTASKVLAQVYAAYHELHDHAAH